MENWRGKNITAYSIMVLMILVSSGESRDPVLHRVGGGKYSWNESSNFTDWASHEHFYVGDWLYFGFNKSKYSVLEVNKTSYEKCIEKDFIANITKGGRDVFNLTQAKPYYFISGFGYCLKGVKVAIFVENSPPQLNDHHLPQIPPLNTNHAPNPPPFLTFFPPSLLHFTSLLILLVFLVCFH